MKPLARSVPANLDRHTNVGADYDRVADALDRQDDIYFRGLADEHGDLGFNGAEPRRHHNNDVISSGKGWDEVGSGSVGLRVKRCRSDLPDFYGSVRNDSALRVYDSTRDAGLLSG